MALSSSFCFLLLLSAVSAQDDYWYPDIDVPQSIQTLTQEELDAVIATKTVIVHFVPGSSEDPAVNKMTTYTRRMLQEASQALNHPNTIFTEVDMSVNTAICEAHDVTEPNTVLVYKSGRRHEFQGYRTAEVLVSYISQIGKPLIGIISSKADKKTFEKRQGLKVLGYFDTVTPAYQVFVEAAEYFYPDFPFYMVLDPLMATQMKLTAPGEVVIVRPPRKQVILASSPLASLADYEAFLASVKPPMLQFVTLEFFHSVMDTSDTEPFIVVFSRHLAPENKPLFKALKHIAKTENTTVSVRIFDVDKYPMLHRQLSTKFAVDPLKPALGLFNMTDGNTTWFNVSQLDGVTNKTEGASLVYDWLLDIQLGNIRVDGLPSAEIPKPRKVTPSALNQGVPLELLHADVQTPGISKIQIIPDDINLLNTGPKVSKKKKKHKMQKDNKNKEKKTTKSSKDEL